MLLRAASGQLMAQAVCTDLCRYGLDDAGATACLVSFLLDLDAASFSRRPHDG